MPLPVIGLIPLDDRPCNRVFPAQLIEVIGGQLEMPPQEMLGWYTRPGDCDALIEWLRSRTFERLVVSVDMLCYGGLVASRTGAVDADTAARRLDVLRTVKERRPELSIFAFSTLTRLGITVTSDSDLEVHELLREYCQLVDRVERLGEESARPELDATVERVGPSVLADYLEVRRRNHGINRAVTDLVADKVVEYLVLAQEDAAPVGIHIPEQMALRDQTVEHRAADRVTIRPGADEAGLVLVARHCALADGRTPRIALDFASGEGADTIPLFESQPLRTTAEALIRDAGAVAVAPESAEATLLVHTPIEGQRDVTTSACSEPASALVEQAAALPRRIDDLARSQHLLGLADVAYCNGADPGLITALRETEALKHLTAYAGWNTAANTVGTAAGHLCVSALVGGTRNAASERASSLFLASRLIDDYGYQSCVRQRAAGLAAADGVDPHALGTAGPKLRDFISAEMQPFARELCSDLAGEIVSAAPEPVRVGLPWERLFEIELEIAPSLALAGR
jgi:hypothetical protein